MRSPFAELLDSALVVITVTGRRTGRRLSLPVQWAPGADALWVWPAQPGTKRWWRNLLDGADVDLRLLGKDVRASGRAITSATDPDRFAIGLSAYQRRFPRSAGSLGQPGNDVLVELTIPTTVVEEVRARVDVPGRGVTAWARRHPLTAYFVLALLFSWSFWVPDALAGGTRSHFPGLLGPALAAVSVAMLTGGRSGLRGLVSRMGHWRVPVRWYAVSVGPLLVAGLALVAVGIINGWPTGAELSRLPGVPNVGWIGVFLMVTIVNGFGEEVGWRGFAWPRLRDRHTLGGAALLLTIPWAIWHLPLLWIDSGMRGFSVLLLPGFLVSLGAGSLVLGWLYERSGSSVPVVALWHAAFNMATATDGTTRAAPYVSGMVIVAATCILRADRRSERPVDRTANHNESALLLDRTSESVQPRS